MDYSFLIGIHRPEFAQPDAKEKIRHNPVTYDDERCFTADQGGMASSSASGIREVYYVGIIDILQEYNLWKRSETAVRGLVDDPTEISSVHPKAYASRFVEFLSTVIA